MTYPSASKFEILLVEDSPTDQKLFSMALKESPTSVRCVTDGEKALSLFNKPEEDAPLSPPQLIVLDLNIPIKDGFEVLSNLKSNPNFKSIPIVVFSTSSNEKDIKKCYLLGANAFVTKPLDLDKYLDTVKKIVEYWGVVCSNPAF